MTAGAEDPSVAVNRCAYVGLGRVVVGSGDGVTAGAGDLR
jgi:hypothetical protein